MCSQTTISNFSLWYFFSDLKNNIADAYTSGKFYGKLHIVSFTTDKWFQERKKVEVSFLFFKRFFSCPFISFARSDSVISVAHIHMGVSNEFNRNKKCLRAELFYSDF